jgi:predicted enzyme related to lactoylglutathione lyase
MAALHIGAVTFDCHDPARQGAFWASVLGWEVAPPVSDELAVVGGPNRPQDAPIMLFIKVPEPKSAKNRNHLDLHTLDLDADVTRIVALGAGVVHEKHEWGVHWFTLADPEGNEFCIVEDRAEPGAERGGTSEPVEASDGG